MYNKKMLFFFSCLIILAFLLVACQPETVIETVVVEKVVEVEKEVVVTKEVEVEVIKEVEVEVPTGGELVTIVARCKASPPHEDGRCNNLVSAVGAANAALAAAGDDRRIELEIIHRVRVGFGCWPSARHRLLRPRAYRRLGSRRTAGGHHRHARRLPRIRRRD